MRGWLAVPLIGSDGANYGFIQASDRLEGEFTEQDEANLVRLAAGAHVDGTRCARTAPFARLSAQARRAGFRVDIGQADRLKLTHRWSTDSCLNERSTVSAPAPVTRH